MNLEAATAIEETRLTFKDSALAGLRQPDKRLSCKYFYDKRGSELFDQICELDEYYLTRTELAIMQQYAAEMGEQIDEGVRLVEYGSGSSTKTRILLDHLPDPVAYVPVDISREHLISTAKSIQQDYPHIEVLPTVADFTKTFTLPEPKRPATHSAVYFPGSTIGNFEPHEAEQLLAVISHLCGRGGGLLIGVDLVKDRDVLEAAYNDSQGVTAQFNLNLLHRLKNELGAELELDDFSHFAQFNDEHQRIEIFIRSEREQTLRIGEEAFELNEGELIHTEYSHKYTIGGFAELAKNAGLTLRRGWTDERDYFAVLHFAVLERPIRIV